LTAVVPVSQSDAIGEHLDLETISPRHAYDCEEIRVNRRLSAKKTDVGLWIIVEEMPEHLFEVFKRRTIREAHRVHVRQANGASLITEIGDVYGNSGRLLVSLMVAGATVQRARGRGRISIIRYLSLPAPFTSVSGNKRRGSPAIRAEFHEIHVVVSDLITGVGRFATFLAQT
jgi:hypothetical protein